MAWICVDLDGTLVSEDGMGGEAPIPGSVEAMNMLAQQGHRLTVFTARLGAMPAQMREQMKQEIIQTLAQYGFPQMEVWTATHKPGCDLFIDDRAVTFDNDWDLALSQVQMMLEERGLAAAEPPPDDGSGGYPGAPTDEEMPPEQ
jgi:ribonucleotide monophosphatase NagD (HAD superfamily)